MSETVISTFKNRKEPPQETPQKTKRIRWTKKNTQLLIKTCKEHPDVKDNAICEFFPHHPASSHDRIIRKIHQLRRKGLLPKKYKKRVQEDRDSEALEKTHIAFKDLVKENVTEQLTSTFTKLAKDIHVIHKTFDETLEGTSDLEKAIILGTYVWYLEEKKRGS